MTFDASSSKEFQAIQRVTTNQGSSLQNVRIHALHLNGISASVDFMVDEKVYYKVNILPNTVCKDGNFLDLPENPTKEGVKFGGWVCEDGEPFAATGPITENLTLYAKWLDPHAIALVSDGEVYRSLTAYAGDVISLPSLESTSERKFKGWSTDNGSFVEYNQSQPISGDLTLYARWAGMCYITLISEGEVHSSMRAEEGETISLTPPEPTSDKTFLRWSEQKNGLTEYDQSQPVTGNMVLYAVWSEEDDKAAHKDMTSMIILIPLIVILAILLFSRIHRNKVRIVPGSSKGRFGRK